MKRCENRTYLHWVPRLGPDPLGPGQDKAEVEVRLGALAFGSLNKHA